MMTRDQYFQSAFKALCEGRISDDEYDIIIRNADIFSEKETEEEEEEN